MKHFDEALMHHFNRRGSVYRCGGISLWGFLFGRNQLVQAKKSAGAGELGFNEFF